MHSFIKKFDSLLKDYKRILVTSHRNPDTDAIASILAMAHYIDARYPEAEITMAIEGPAIDVASHLPHFKLIKWVPRMYELALANELIVVVDANHPQRISSEPDLFPLTFRPIVYVDHHPNPILEHTLLYSDTSAAATTQILTEQFFTKNSELSKELCTILLSGILSDTGSFRYLNPLVSRVLNTTERLITVGKLDVEPIEGQMSRVPSGALPILEFMMHHTQFVTIPPYQPLMYSFISKDVARQHQQNNVVAAWGFYKHQFLRQLDDTAWGFVVQPKGESFYISFRSSPGAPNVIPLAQHFGGGGHPQAAAGTYEPTANQEGLQTEAVCQMVLDVIKSFDQTQLIRS